MESHFLQCLIFIKSCFTLSFLQSQFDLPLQVLEMDEFLQGGQFIGLDFLKGQESLGPPSGQLDGADLLLTQSILLLVEFDLPTFLLLGRVVVGIDDEIVLAQHSSLPHVVVVD